MSNSTINSLETIGRVHRVYEDAVHRNDKSTYKYYYDMIQKAQKDENSDVDAESAPVDVTAQDLKAKRLNPDVATKFIESLSKNEILKEHQYRMHAVPGSIEIDNY
jgi:hypothetical protein